MIVYKKKIVMKKGERKTKPKVDVFNVYWCYVDIKFCEDLLKLSENLNFHPPST